MSEDPKKLAGSQKPSMHYVPMNVMIGVARVFEFGAARYGLKNWRKQPVAMTTYYSAIHRHLVQFFEVGVDLDNESKQHHLDHVIASCMILRDGIDRKSIIDDRFDYEVKTGEQALNQLKPLTIIPQKEQSGKIIDHTIFSSKEGAYGTGGGGGSFPENPRRVADKVDVGKLLGAIEEDVLDRPQIKSKP